MFVYAGVLLSCLVLLTLASQGSVSLQKWATLCCVAGLTSFAAIRGYVGTDTYAYHTMFSDFSGESLSDIFVVIEPVFAVLIKFVALLSDNPFVYMICIAIIEGLLLAYAALTSRDPIRFLSLYLVIFYLNLHFNVVRAGVAILLLILAMRVPKDSGHEIRFFVLGLLAVLSHYSAILGFVPLLLLRHHAAHSKWIAAGSVVLLLGVIYVSADASVFVRYLDYVDLLVPDVTKTVSLSFLLSVPLYAMLYACAVTKRNKVRITLLFATWLFLRWLTSIFSLVGRVEMIVNALLLFSIVELALSGWRQRLRAWALTGLTAMWFFGALIGLQQEESILEGLGVAGLYTQSPFVPYKFMWEDNQ